MEVSAFQVQQDFQSLRLNESKHGLASPFGFFQDRDFQLVGAEGCLVSTPLSDQIMGPDLPETAARNLVPTSRISEQPRFKQRTFSGKPLADDEVIQANQLAGELEDKLHLRRLLGR